MAAHGAPPSPWPWPSRDARRRRPVARPCTSRGCRWGWTGAAGVAVAGARAGLCGLLRVERVFPPLWGVGPAGLWGVCGPLWWLGDCAAAASGLTTVRMPANHPPCPG